MINMTVAGIAALRIYVVLVVRPLTPIVRWLSVRLGS